MCGVLLSCDASRGWSVLISSYCTTNHSMEPDITPITFSATFDDKTIKPGYLPKKFICLTIRNCQANDWSAIVEAICKHHEVEELTFINTHIRSKDLYALSSLPALRRLAIHGSDVDLWWMIPEGHYKSLEHLAIGNSPINIRPELAQMIRGSLPHLKELEFSLLFKDPQRMTFGASTLALCKNLNERLLSQMVESLAIVRCKQLTIQFYGLGGNFRAAELKALEDVISHPQFTAYIERTDVVRLIGPRQTEDRTKLDQLKLAARVLIGKGTRIARTVQMSGFGDRQVQVLGENATMLTRLSLQGAEMTIASAKLIADHFQMVIELRLGYACIGDEGVAIITRRLKYLSSLSLISCQIGPDGVREIVHSLPELKDLKLNYNRIGFEMARFLLTRLSSLRMLGLQATGLTDDSVPALLRMRRQRMALSIGGNGLQKWNVYRLRRIVPLNCAIYN